MQQELLLLELSLGLLLFAEVGRQLELSLLGQRIEHVWVHEYRSLRLLRHRSQLREEQILQGVVRVYL